MNAEKIKHKRAMPVDNRYERINNSFERAVTKLQENLQYLADNDKVSKRFLSFQNLILKSIIEYQEQTEMYISTLEMENMQLVVGKINEIEKLKDIQESFEAICIIHGIMDFPAWMRKRKNYLVHEAVFLYKEGMVTIPYQLKEKMDKLPDPEREAIYKILYGDLK